MRGRRGMCVRGRRSAILVPLALLWACTSPGEQGDSPPLQPPATEAATTVPDDVRKPLPPDAMVECGGSSPFPAAALNRTVPLEEADVPAAALGPIENFLATGEGDFWPQDGYRVLHQTDSSLLLVRVGEAGNTVFLGAELADGQWRPTDTSSGGPCQIRIPLPPELHEVDWRLNPDQELDDATAEVSVLATGRACSSGQPMGERLQPPTILLTDTTLFISLAAEQPGDVQTCPGNPEELVTINIGEGLGDRQIANGRTTAGLITDYVPAS